MCARLLSGIFSECSRQVPHQTCVPDGSLPTCGLPSIRLSAIFGTRMRGCSSDAYGLRATEKEARDTPEEALGLEEAGASSGHPLWLCGLWLSCRAGDLGSFAP